MRCIRRLVSTKTRLTVVCALGGSLVLFGCSAARPAPRAEMAGDVVVNAQDDLKEKLNSFVEFFQTTIESAAADIERRASTKEQRKAAAMWRVRMVEECHATINQDDAREVLVDLWTLCDRMHAFLTQGEGKAVFGPFQPTAVACSEKIDQALEKLVAQYVPQESLAKMTEKIKAYSSVHPIRGDFAAAPAERLSDTPDMEKRLGELVTLPLAPLTALGAIGRTPESVRDVSKSVYRFSDVLEEFPASARWQLQLLSANLEESAMVTGAVGSFKQLSDSSAQVAKDTSRFVQIADELPVRVREQAQVLLKSVDESQPGLQKTLNEAQKAASTVRETVGSVDKTVLDVRESAVALEQAANAVSVTAKEILKFVPSDMKDETGQIIGDKLSEQPVEIAKDDSFSFQAVTESAKSLGATTDKLRQLLGDVRAFVDDGTLSTGTTAIDQQMRGTVDFSVVRLEGVVDHAAKRLAQLLLLAFLLAMIYRLIAGKLMQARQPEPKPACLADE